MPPALLAVIAPRSARCRARHRRLRLVTASSPRNAPSLVIGGVTPLRG